MTRLGDKIQTGTVASAKPSVATPLARKLAGGRRGETVDVPGLGAVRVELVGPVAWAEIEAQCFADLKAAGLELNVLTAELFEMGRARRTLALACRNPDNHAEPFGTLEQWGEVDTSLVNVAWQAFGDVKERLDPLSSPLTAEEREVITSAVKKKDAPLLRSFGVLRLSAWLATTDGLLSSSPPPSSSSSESSPGGSSS